MATASPTDPKLVCLECGASSEDGAGYRADIVTDDEDVDETQVDVWCPECWRRKFGGDA